MNTVKKGGPKVKNSTIIFCSYCFLGGSKPELARMQKKAIKKHTERAQKGVNTILILLRGSDRRIIWFGIES